MNTPKTPDQDGSKLKRKTDEAASKIQTKEEQSDNRRKKQKTTYSFLANTTNKKDPKSDQNDFKNNEHKNEGPCTSNKKKHFITDNDACSEVSEKKRRKKDTNDLVIISSTTMKSMEVGNKKSITSRIVSVESFEPKIKTSESEKKLQKESDLLLKAKFFEKPTNPKDIKSNPTQSIHVESLKETEKANFGLEIEERNIEKKLKKVSIGTSCESIPEKKANSSKRIHSTLLFIIILFFTFCSSEIGNDYFFSKFYQRKKAVPITGLEIPLPPRLNQNSLYISGAGFSGFWFTLGHLLSRPYPFFQIKNDSAGIDYDVDPEYYCYSSGCLALVTAMFPVVPYPNTNDTKALLNARVQNGEYVLDLAISFQQQWQDGIISRYEILEGFVYGLIPTDSIDQDYDPYFLNQIRILATSRDSGPTAITPANREHLRELLIQSAWM